MIPNVTKGGDMHGLVRYLVSSPDVDRLSRNPQMNAHTDPHVISGDPFLVAWYGTQVLDGAAAGEIATYLDKPRRVHGTEVRTGCWQQNPETGAREAVRDVDGHQVYRNQHVWHCSLSLAPGEGPLSGEQWDAVATDFAARMGFTAVSGHAPARWVAIHHGASKGGHDHIHIAASMVREDGTRWEGRLRDFPKSQQVCRDLEARYGLVAVDGRQHGTVGKGVRPVERRVAEQSGQLVTARAELAHRVRAAAVASTSEAEWVRRVRACGVVIKPRFVAGSVDVVAGYRVALRPQSGADRLNFYGGGQLGNDLSLPRVRENWPEPSVEQADAASAEWQATFRGQPPAVAKTAGEIRLGKTAPEVASRYLTAFSDRLQTVPATDRVGWSDAARDISGALSAWARYDPVLAPELRTAAAVLARSAQDRRPGGQLGRRVRESPMGTALIFLAATSDDKPKIAAGVLMAQILRTATAIRDYHTATTNLHQARAVNAVITRLQGVPLPGYQPDLAAMSTGEREAWNARQQVADAFAAPPREPGPPLPNPLLPRPQIGARTNPREGDRDAGR